MTVKRSNRSATVKKPGRSAAVKGPNPYDSYEKAVATMNMPEMRKTASNANASWFIRDGWIGNKNHNNFGRAREAALKIISSH